MKTILVIIYLSPFIRFVYTDLRQQKVYDQDVLITFFLYLILNMKGKSFLNLFFHFINTLLIYFSLILITLLIEKLRHKYLMGGGDLKLLALIVWGYGLKEMISSLLFASLIILIFYNFFFSAKIIKDELVIFAPFLSAGLLFTVILQHLAL